MIYIESVKIFLKIEIEKVNVYLLLLYQKKNVNFCHRNIQRLTPAVFYIKRWDCLQKKNGLPLFDFCIFGPCVWMDV